MITHEQATSLGYGQRFSMRIRLEIIWDERWFKIDRRTAVTLLDDREFVEPYPLHWPCAYWSWRYAAISVGRYTLHVFPL